MRFFVDAQLPPTLKMWLIEQGHDCTHALDLIDKDRTSDSEIVKFVTKENRILVSKDSDFLKMKLLTGLPQKLLIVSTGNIINRDLMVSFRMNFQAALRLFETFEIVELGNQFVSGRNTDL